MSIQQETKSRHSKAGTKVLGARKVVKQHPHRKPRKLKKSPRPSCHSSSKEGRKAFRDAYREFVAAYRVASRRLRQGKLDVEFPENSFPPALAFVGPGPAPI